MKKILIPLFLITLFCGVLTAQTLPPIAHTNDPHVLTDRRVQFKEFLLPPRSFSPAMPSQVPLNLRDGALMYNQTLRKYMRFDSIANIFVAIEGSSAFLPLTFTTDNQVRIRSHNFLITSDTVGGQFYFMQHNDAGLTLESSTGRWSAGFGITGFGPSFGIKNFPSGKTIGWRGDTTGFVYSDKVNKIPPKADSLYSQVSRQDVALWGNVIDTINAYAYRFDSNFHLVGDSVHLANSIRLNSRVTADTGMRIGISTTPAWATTYKVLNMAGNVGLRSLTSGHNLLLFNNIYNTDGSSTWHYTGNGYGSSLYLDEGGGLNFYSVPSSTAGSTVSITAPIFSVTRNGAALRTMRDTTVSDTIVGYLRGELVKMPFSGGGGSNTLYIANDSIHNTDRTVDLKLHTLLFKGQSAADSVALSVDHANGFFSDNYDKAHNLNSALSSNASGNDMASIDSLGNEADIFTNAVSGTPHANILLNVLQPSTGTAAQIAITTPHSGDRIISVKNKIDNTGIGYDSYLDYLNADSLTLMPKQYNDAHYAPIAGGGYVPTSRTITINGTTLDLSANRSWTVGSTITPVSGETPTGTINGTNPTFTIAHTPISGSVSVYINGIMERPTTDWTISGTTITMIDIPTTGDNLMVNYQY